MGYAISWMAVKGKNSKDILDLLELSETSESYELPESDFNSAELPSGWYFLWFNECESPYVQREVVLPLSDECSVITCVIEEHVMYVRTEYWENGAQSWVIVHDSQKGIFNLEASGCLPDSFEPIKTEMFAEQTAAGGKKADVDYIFDVPLEVVRQITFFKHDEETPELEGIEFKVLKSNKIQFPPMPEIKKPWWKVW